MVNVAARASILNGRDNSPASARPTLVRNRHFTAAKALHIPLCTKSEDLVAVAVELTAGAGHTELFVGSCPADMTVGNDELPCLSDSMQRKRKE